MLTGQGKPMLIMHTGFVHAISLECSRLRKSAFYFSPLCSTEALGIVNRPLDSLLRACAERGYSSWFVCLSSVSLSVCVDAYSGTTGYPKSTASELQMREN